MLGAGQRFACVEPWIVVRRMNGRSAITSFSLFIRSLTVPFIRAAWTVGRRRTERQHTPCRPMWLPRGARPQVLVLRGIKGEADVDWVTAGSRWQLPYVG